MKGEESVGKVLYNEFLNRQYPQLAQQPELQWERLVNTDFLERL